MGVVTYPHFPSPTLIRACEGLGEARIPGEPREAGEKLRTPGSGPSFGFLMDRSCFNKTEPPEQGAHQAFSPGSLPEEEREMGPEPGDAGIPAKKEF